MEVSIATEESPEDLLSQMLTRLPVGSDQGTILLSRMKKDIPEYVKVNPGLATAANLEEVENFIGKAEAVKAPVALVNSFRDIFGVVLTK